MRLVAWAMALVCAARPTESSFAIRRYSAICASVSAHSTLLAASCRVRLNICPAICSAWLAFASAAPRCSRLPNTEPHTGPRRPWPMPMFPFMALTKSCLKFAQILELVFFQLASNWATLWPVVALKS